MAGLLLLGGAVCWIALAYNSSRQLYYQGKPLAYWFNQLPMTMIQRQGNMETVFQTMFRHQRHAASGAVRDYGANGQASEISKEAVRIIGTNGLSFYLSKLKRRHWSFQTRIQKAVFALGLRQFIFADISAEREQAVTALILIRPLPEEAVRELRSLSTNTSTEIAAAAYSALTIDRKKLLPGPPSRLDDIIRGVVLEVKSNTPAHK